MIPKILIKLKKEIERSAMELLYKFLMTPDKWFAGRRLFGAEELKLLHQALLSQSLFGIDGKMVGAFEKEFARAYGVPYAVASTSGTAAIETALGAICLNPGDEVITAPITDLGTIIPIINQGGIPVFADVNDLYLMDPADVERKITARTKAIIVVHLFGNPCDMDAMAAVAKKHNVALIEDCCQAHMTEYKGKYAGTIGDIGCFSFQQSKHMTTGDGGMTVTANKEYYDHMKLFVDKGYTRKSWGARTYLFHAPNYRMNELTAAVGLAQLKKVKGVVKKRNELGSHLTQLLTDVGGIHTAPVTPGGSHSYWCYPLYIEGGHLEPFAEKLKKGHINGMIGYTVKPIYLCTESLVAKKTYGHSQYPFSWKDVDKTYEYKEGLCPKAEEILKHLFCLTFNECWTRERMDHVAEVIKNTGDFMSGVKKRGVSSVTVELKKETAAADPAGSKKIRIGIVGCGLMGNTHLTAYKKNPEVEIAACADSDFGKAEQCAGRVKANTYASHKEMLAHEKLDGISICTVPSTHREIVLDALEAGVNVLCEKPLATSVAEAREMTDKANQKKKLLLTAFKFRFFEEVQQAKELLRKGSLGKVTRFRLMFGGFMDMKGSWYANKDISGGGIVIDNGPHAIDLVRYVLGDIKEVSARLSNLQDIAVEDTALLNLVLENGATGTVDISWSTPVPAAHYLEIYGTEGTALLDFNGFSYKFKTWNEFKRVANIRNSKEAFAAQIDHFVAAIKDYRPTAVNNDDGLRAQEVIEKAYQSAC
jgi:dTDP-4-amino-4,6-dideoxygalactose transaminase